MRKLPTNQVFKILLVVFCFIMTAKTDCFASYSPPQTTYGQIIANLQQLSNQTTLFQNYNYPVIQQIKQLQLAKNIISVNGFRFQKKGLSFGFKVQSFFPQNHINNILFKVTIMQAKKNKWSYITFSFIITSIPQILAGTKTVILSSPTEGQNKFKVTQKINIPRNTNFNYFSHTVIFINGLQIEQKVTLNSQEFRKIEQNVNKLRILKNFSWDQKIINKLISLASFKKDPNIFISKSQFNQKTLTFQIQYQELKLVNVVYSYLIYLQRTRSCTYQAIFESFTAFDKQSTSFYRTNNDQTRIFGINGIRFQRSLTGQFSLEVLQDQNKEKRFYYFKVLGNNAQFKLNYFSFQVIPTSLCQNCIGSPLLFQQFCVSQCPLGYVATINKNNIYQCIKCNIQKFFIADQNKRICDCSVGYFLVAPLQRCLKCPYDCLTCNGITCLTCDLQMPQTFRRLNETTNRCQCPQINYLGKGLYDDKLNQLKQCVQCDSRCQTCLGPKNTDCTSCLPFRQLSNGYCKCKENFIQNSRGLCICQYPFSLNSQQKCILNSQRCPSNEQIIILPSNHKSCKCVLGYQRSIASNRCIKSCQSTEYYNIESDKCQCKKGLARNQTSKTCYICQLRLNKLYNEHTKKCQCIQGFEMNKSGDCILCPSKTYFNYKNNRCECVFNYYRRNSNQNCIKCNNQWENSDCKVFKSDTQLAI